MRVAIVANTAWYLYNFRLNLMHEIRGAGHDVVAVAPYDAYASKIVDAGFVFESIPLSGQGVNPFSEALSVLRLLCVFYFSKIDLVFSYTPKGNLYSALASIALGRRFVPNVSGLGSSFIKRTFVTSVVHFLYRLTFRRAHVVFFQNSDDMEVFVGLDFVAPARAKRLPGSGVDLLRFNASPEDASRDSVVTFLLVARMLWDKGVGEYVEAAREVKKRYPNVRFVMMGSAGVSNPSAISRANIEAWVREGVVEYFDHVEDVRPWLSQASCVVLPSYREGVPRTLLEAAAMSRPIIATNAPGCKDTVVDGVTGFLCEVKSARDLAVKCIRFVELDVKSRSLMGQAGRQYIEKHFDERFVLCSYMSVLSEIKS